MKIGIVAWKLGDNSFGVTSPYIAYFEMFGDVVLVKHDETVRFDLDLIVVPGGPDVNPARYNQKPHVFTGKPCNYREYFDVAILPQYIENHIPVFGICRGMQSIAVSFGGQLLQHMSHETSEAHKRWEEVHNIIYKPHNGPITYDSVNSIHHQVVSNTNFPEELKVIARYLPKNKKHNDQTGLIEGYIHREKPIAAIQFHPEELYTNDLANSLVETLLTEPENLNNKYDEIGSHSTNTLKKSFSKSFKG